MDAHFSLCLPKIIFNKQRWAVFLSVWRNAKFVKFCVLVLALGANEILSKWVLIFAYFHITVIMNHSYFDKCVRFTGKIHITPRCHLCRHLGNWAYKNIRISFRQSSFMLEVWGPPLYCQIGNPELLKRMKNAELERLKLSSLSIFSIFFYYFFS